MFFKQRSLRANFIIKLTAAMVVLELFFSSVFYAYINYSVDSGLKESMIKQAKYLFSTYDDVAKAVEDKNDILQETMKLKARIIPVPNANFRSIYFRKYKEKDHYYLEGYFPYEFALQKYLVLTADVTKQKKMENQVSRGIIMVNVFGMVGILIYAFLLSNMLLAPLRVFSKKLAKMNENALSPIDLKGIPDEFLNLGRSVNGLISRIQSFMNYKKELFVGTAHELKTPLAVMKAKSQVALLKRKKTEEDLIGALKQNIDSIDDMDKIISSILEFGRAEGAQFEKPETIDLIRFLTSICDEFKLLAEKEGKKLKCNLHPKKSIVTIPPLLLKQIIQNLLQNAIRFTPENKKIKLVSYQKNENMHIVVRDEGEGVDESIDLFAPFKRSQDSSGAGLGLFLVKSAADALQAKVTIKNRSDKNGVVAMLILPIKAPTFK